MPTIRGIYGSDYQDPLAPGDPVYRPSFDEETIVIQATRSTVTSIAAFGSADGFASPGTDFGDDESIRVGGGVQASDNADLTAGSVEVRVNGSVVGSVALYGFDGAVNYWMMDLGTLPSGTYIVRATFQRLRI